MTKRAASQVSVFSPGYWSPRRVFSTLALVLVPLTVLNALFLILPYVPPQSRIGVAVQGGVIGLVLTLGTLSFVARLAKDPASLTERVAAHTAELEIQYARESALSSIEPNIGQPDDLADLLGRMVDLAAQALGTTGASILLRDTDTDCFAAVATTASLRPIQDAVAGVRNDTGSTHWIVTHGQPLVLRDREDPAALSAMPVPLNPLLAEVGVRAFAGVPLLAQEEVVGVLYVLHKDARDFSGA